MHYSLELLVLGRRDVARFFREARKRWLLIFLEEQSSPIEIISQRVSREQVWFEKNCGGIQLGKEIMAWSLFATFYSTSKGLRPSRKKFLQKVTSAFSQNFCSIEIKHEVSNAAHSYGLTSTT